jgi:hypothetical protein
VQQNEGAPEEGQYWKRYHATVKDTKPKNIRNIFESKYFEKTGRGERIIESRLMRAGGVSKSEEKGNKEREAS